MPKTLVISSDFGLTEPNGLRRWKDTPNYEALVYDAENVIKRKLKPFRAYRPKLFAFKNDVATLEYVGGIS